MATGGFSKLPDGTVVVALGLSRPCGTGEPVRVLVLARNRQRALTRLRNLGFRGARLNGNSEPPSSDEVNAVLHHPDGLVWRNSAARAGEMWRPIGHLSRDVPVG